MRTSLARSPSNYTDDQLAHSNDRYRRDLYLVHNSVVIRLDDPEIPGLVRTALEAMALARWGKRA
jgi:hypothetical protein